MLDTRHFSREFTLKLLAVTDNLDASLDGVCFHSENFQALQLMQERYREQVKCVYIDPPYNTTSSEILYKNNYKHSSWGTLMRDRLELLARTMRQDSAIFVSIDNHERTILERAMDQVFGSDNHIEELIWSMNTNNSQAPNYSTNHEYVLVYAKDRATAENDKDMFREPKPGFEAVMELVARLNPEYPSIAMMEEELRKLYEQHRIEFREEIEAQGLEWEDEKGNDPWKGLFNYSGAEYRDANGALVAEGEAKAQKAKIWIWREADSSMPATKQAESTRDPKHPNWRFYKPLHPKTGKPCPHPKSGWKFAYDDDADSPEKRSFVSLDRDHRIAWGPDEKKGPRLKRMLHEVETNVGKRFSRLLRRRKADISPFRAVGCLSRPKAHQLCFTVHSALLQKGRHHLGLLRRLGHTAHAVITINRHDRGKRKYVMVEMGDHFETIIVPRLKKVAYSSDWKDGKPSHRKTGISHGFKIVRLESYEDTLNNLHLRRTPEQEAALDQGWRGQPRSIPAQLFPRCGERRKQQPAGHYPVVRAIRLQTAHCDLQRRRNRGNHRGPGRDVQLAPRAESEAHRHRQRLPYRHRREANRWALSNRLAHPFRRPQSRQRVPRKFPRQARREPGRTEFEFLYVNGAHSLHDPHNKVHLIEETFQRLMFDTTNFESLS